MVSCFADQGKVFGIRCVSVEYEKYVQDYPYVFDEIAKEEKRRLADKVRPNCFLFETVATAVVPTG